MTRCSLLVAALALASTVHAQDDADAWVARAQQAERAAHPREAVEAWSQVIARWPTSRMAARARTRVEWMEARSEGDYAPLSAMMRFVDAPLPQRDARALTSFEDAVHAMPPGHVRAESRVAIAGEWQRLGETQRALDAWQAALDDPDLDPGTRDLIRESMARTRMSAGDLDGALRELDDAGLERTDLERLAARRLRIAQRLPIAWAALALHALLVIMVLARSGRMRQALAITPLRAMIALAIGAGPYAIVQWWGDDSLSAFAAFAPCATLIVLAGFAIGGATDSARVRGALAVMSLVAALAGAYASVALYGDALPFA